MELLEQIEELRKSIVKDQEKLKTLEEKYKKSDISFKEKVNLWCTSDNREETSYDGGSVRDYYFDNIYDGERYSVINADEILYQIVEDSEFSENCEDVYTCFCEPYETLIDKKYFNGTKERHDEFCAFIEPYIKDLYKDNVLTFKADW